MQENMVLKKNPDIVSRVIDNEVILVPIFKTSEEMNCIYTLNPVASAVWDLIDGKRSIKQLKESILKKFDTAPEETEREMAKFFSELKKIKAVV